MRLSQYLIIITHLMALLGLYAVTLIGGVSPIFILFMGGAIIANLFLRSWTSHLVPRGLWNIIAILIFIVFLSDFFWGGRDLTASAARFLTLLLTAKLFDLHSNRDYIMVYGTVFFQILAAAASTMSIHFLPVLLLFIMGSIFAMITVTIQKEFEIGKNTGAEPPRGLFDLTFIIYAIILSSVTITLTFLLFMILPRMEAGLLQHKNHDALKVVGFSDTVDLNALGPVKKDPTVIMRVDFPGMDKRPGGPLYFRGTTLSSYDGRAWHRGRTRERLMKKGGGEFLFPAKPRGKIMEERILLEPLNSNVLFTIPNALRISGKFKDLWADPSGTVYLPSPVLTRMEYRVWSAPAAIRPVEQGNMADFVDLSYMDKGLLKRIRALAMKITAKGTGDVEKSGMIKNYLRTNYTYTLDPRTNQRRDPIEDFLFYSKEGYCEHFSTAYVILSRSIGIPARIVTGFLEGEWNNTGKYFIVRQSDAHSWAETYIGGSVGWIRADATPAEGLSPLMRGTTLSNYMDYMHLEWNRYVVNYTSTDQKKLAFTFTESGRRLITGLRDSLHDAASYRMERQEFLLILLLAAFMALLIVRTRDRRNRLSLTRVPAFYLEMLKILRKRGMEKETSETAMEFAERIRWPGVRELTEIYEEVRFGRGRCKSGQYREVKDIIRDLKSSKTPS